MSFTQPFAKKMKKLQSDMRTEKAILQQANRKTVEIDLKIQSVHASYLETKKRIIEEEYRLSTDKVLKSNYSAASEDIVYLQNKIKKLSANLTLRVFKQRKGNSKAD